MTKMKDLTGDKFGWLSAVQRHRSPGAVRWDCVCECGRSKAVLAKNLLSGATRSCGCRGLYAPTRTEPTPVPLPTQAAEPTMADLLAELNTLVQ